MATRLPLAALVGQCAVIDALREQVRRLGRISEGRLPSILLLGETGTGKGLVAGLLHGTGPRHTGPFVDVNCAAIPETLLEAELFGFERGAFTDARAAKRGLLEAAHRGTLFLDEIGALPDVLQAKLLTAIESRQIRRLGSTRNESVDVWIIAATSEDLATAMKAGRFRRELYHRLSTVVLHLPPLRARGEDILILADHFLARAAADHGIPPKRLAEDARDALLAHAWPGNVRELGNVLERVMLLEDGPVITAAMLALPNPASDDLHEPTPASLLSSEALRADERQQLAAALNAARGNISRAAASLGIPRNTLRYRLAKHELYPHEAAPGDGPYDQATEDPAPAKGIRWEERLVAVLGAAIAALPEGGSFEPAAVIPELIEKLTSFGARIEQFTPSELVAVFGIDPMEDAARRAVLAAHAMLQALRRCEGDRHGRFAVHVGSYLIARSGAITGMDAHARRRASDIVSALIQQAGPDQVVVDAAAARFLERHFTMEAIGSGPGAPARIVGRERPRFEVGGRTLSRFVGRVREVEALNALMERAGRGETQIVGLVGEPGVGKSRLVFELTHSHRVQGCLVLEAGGGSHGTATSYLPVTDLLRGYFRIGDRDTQRDIREKITGKVLALDRALEPTLPALLALLELPVEDSRWQRLDPSQRRQRTLDAVTRLLLREAQVRPLLVIFEDLHLIDTETQACLDRLAESPGTAPLLLLVTYRPEYRDAWSGKTNRTQLRLDPLPPESAYELLDALLGADVALSPLKQLLVERTEANPLFLEESVRALVETAVLAGERGAYRLTRPVEYLTIPATVQAILAARIDRLAPEAKRLLQAAAVIGKDVPLPLLLAIADAPEPEVRAELTHLQTAEFLYETRLFPDLEYTFKHALTHEVAYGGLLHDRQRTLHARIAEAIERLAPERLAEQAERLAHHAMRGEVWDKAVAYLRKAGHRAIARAANREAITHLEHALGALRRLPEARATTELTIDIRLDLWNALLPLGDWARLGEHFHEAEVLARMLGDQHRLARIATFMVMQHVFNGDYDAALRFGQEALGIARILGDRSIEVVATSFLSWTHAVRGEFSDATTLLGRNIALEGDLRYERFGTPIIQSVFSGALLADVLSQLGRFDEAIAHAETAVRTAEAAADHPHTLYFGLFDLGLAYLRRGDLPRATGGLERCLDHCRTWQIVAGMPAVAATLGASYALAGRADEALPLVVGAVAEFRRGVQNHLRPAFILLCAGMTYLSAGRIDKATSYTREALALARRLGARGSEAHALWLAGDVASTGGAEDAEGHYREALVLAGKLGMRPLVAHCHLGLGKLYRRTGKREQAQEHFTTATTMYREMGMTHWLEKAEAEMND